MDTLLFYFPQNSYRNLFRGVAECYAFSRFHDNVGLRDLPAIRHIKGTNAVVVDHDTLIGNAVLLFSVVHLNRSISSATMRLLSSFFSSSRRVLIFFAFPPCSCS